MRNITSELRGQVVTVALGALLLFACGDDNKGSAADGGPAVGSGGSGGRASGSGGASARGGSGGGASGAGLGGSGAGQGGAGQPPSITPISPLPPRRSGFTVFHSTNVTMWEIHDMAVYTQYKANFDEVIGILERGYFGIAARLGTGHKLPIRVIIEKGGCCGAWAGGGDVGYNDGDFQSDNAMNWIRGVVLGEVVNGVTGAVSSEWPRDWWADTAWYFPGFVTVDVLKEVVPTHAEKWERDEKYPTYPVYQLYKGLLGEQGWAVYQKLFALVKTDAIAWDRIGANPSAIKTNYVIAYMSLAAGQNLGERFQAAKISAADPAVVQAIMDARTKLVQAAAAGMNVTARWGRFRAGDHAGAASGL